MSFTKHQLDHQNEIESVNTDAQYDAEYLEFLRDQDTERRMREEMDSEYLSEILGSMPNEVLDGIF